MTNRTPNSSQYCVLFFLSRAFLVGLFLTRCTLLHLPRLSLEVQVFALDGVWIPSFEVIRGYPLPVVAQFLNGTLQSLKVGCRPLDAPHVAPGVVSVRALH